MPATYCNPLSVPNLLSGEGAGRLFGSLADPEVVRHGSRWWLFVTSSQAWVSDDLIRWERRDVAVPGRIVGPALMERGGTWYLAGNGVPGLYTAPAPEGPWADSGPILDHRGERVHWADLMFFPDDDGTVWCYHHAGTGVGADGIWVNALDPAAGYRRCLGPPVRCVGHDPAHAWERWGAANEHDGVAWIESPWMTKHAGRYYLQYSGCGTEWNRYAVGVYTADRPWGPFVYDDRSPILASGAGLLQGPGHHCLVEHPGGGWWVLYHVLFRNAGKFDRRLCLDRASFDAAGRLVFHGPTETPQFVPGAGGPEGPGWRPVSIDKDVSASSAAPGREPRYANDGSVRTWWQAAAPGPAWLAVDLAAPFVLRAARTIFADAPRPAAAVEGYRYAVEVSGDGAAWRVAADRTAPPAPSDCEYVEFPEPVRARYVRLAIRSAPGGLPPGVVEFTAFGTA